MEFGDATQVECAGEFGDVVFAKRLCQPFPALTTRSALIRDLVQSSDDVPGATVNDANHLFFAPANG